MSDGIVQAWPRRILRAEGAVIFGATIWAYSRLGQSWWKFAGLLFLPDLGMTGFLANTRVGAATYNTTHTEMPAILLLCGAIAQKSDAALGWALCWLGHIGMDRMIGAGLKYTDGFGHTHLGQM
jgi:hypothetical protein